MVLGAVDETTALLEKQWGHSTSPYLVALPRDPLRANSWQSCSLVLAEWARSWLEPLPRRSRRPLSRCVTFVSRHQAMRSAD